MGTTGSHVLLVDDDPLLRALLSRALQAAGFRCTAVSDALEAATTLERVGFSLVLSDVDMPGVSGLALTRAVHAWRPGLPVVLMSGTGGARADEAVRAGASEFLHKPFAPSRAVESVRAALQEG